MKEIEAEQLFSMFHMVTTFVNLLHDTVVEIILFNFPISFDTLFFIIILNALVV